MSNPSLTRLMGAILSVSLLLSGCGSSEDRDVQEKTPPDVIQLTSDGVKSANIQTVLVQERATSSPVLTTGTIQASENRVFHISSFIGGRVIQDNVSLGDTIRAGQTLAVVQNLDVAKVQADYIHELHLNELEIEQARTRDALARKNLERERQLFKEGISPRKDYLQAETEATLARSELEGKQEHQTHIRAEGKALLSVYGLRPDNLQSERIRTGSPVTAPRGGIVTQKHITLGDMVTPEKALYEVADLSQIWLNITIYPKDLSAVRLGQSIAFTTDSLPRQTFTAQIQYLQPEISPNSQTYVARAYLNNPNRILRPGMFGQVRIEQSARQTRPFVPEVAVQKYGRESFVFVPLSQNRFRKQTIQLGEKVGDGYLVNDGLRRGDRVIGNGSFTLKATLLKSQFEDEE